MIKRVLEIFWRFLGLGFVSFGGPAAHIGYFQKIFVQKLHWIDADSYSRLISLSQFLPGPGSSQIGFAIGLRRAGIFGGIAAFIGFTLPSFLLLYFLAITNSEQNSSDLFTGMVHGLKLFAVVVVADAIISMFKLFCKEKMAIAITVLTSAALLLFPSLWTQMGALMAAAFIGVFYGKQKPTQSVKQVHFKLFPLILFLVLLVGLPLLSIVSQWAGIFSVFYQSGSLVFGGGHVVLPLLQQLLGDKVSVDTFLLGYAAAQGVPGPMFSLAAFLGAGLSPENQFVGALMATAGIFLPGFLLLLGLYEAWESLAAKPKIAGAVWGINAAVVGLLMSALYNPVFVSAVFTPVDMALVTIGFFTLNIIRVPIVVLVAGFGAVGILLHN